MLSLLPSLLLLLVLLGQQAHAISVVVLKYSALDRTETGGLQGQHYEFQFCACPSKMSSPTPACSCSIQIGKSVLESTPFALYSKSCLVNPKASKCLIADLQRPDGVVLVKVTLGSRVLTRPEWQDLDDSYRKTTAVLQSSTLNSIKLTYHIFMDQDESNVVENESAKKTTPHAVISTTARPKSTTRSPRRLFHPIKTTKAPTQLAKRALPSFSWPKIQDRRNEVDDFKTSFSQLPSTKELQSLTDIERIKDFLLQRATVAKIKPMIINRAVFRQKMLEYHNAYRSYHDAGPVTYDRTLETSAQAWAEHLATQSSCLQHDPIRRYGENLFYFGSLLFPDETSFAAAVVQSFYMEIKQYQYNTFRPMSYHITGHFTQLVWQSTRRIGVGIAVRNFNGPRTNACQPSRPMSQVWVVVKYDPPGNVQAQSFYQQNVLPKRF